MDLWSCWRGDAKKAVAVGKKNVRRIAFFLILTSVCLWIGGGKEPRQTNARGCELCGIHHVGCRSKQRILWPTLMSQSRVVIDLILTPTLKTNWRLISTSHERPRSLAFKQHRSTLPRPHNSCQKLPFKAPRLSSLPSRTNLFSFDQHKDASYHQRNDQSHQG